VVPPIFHKATLAPSEQSSVARVHRPSNSHWKTEMKAVIGCATIFLTLATVTSADAKGCIKGALVGGTAGHFAGHHGVLGAAAGCVIGRHEANKRAKLQRHQTDQRGERL
jgi:hypothetical protein